MSARPEVIEHLTKWRTDRKGYDKDGQPGDSRSKLGLPTSILRSAGAASLSIGLSFATKFRALPILPPLAVAVAFRWRADPLRGRLAGGLGRASPGSQERLREGPGMFTGRMPEAAGRGIVKAIIEERDVAYVPGFWRPLMPTICVIPERVFKRMWF